MWQFNLARVEDLTEWPFDKTSETILVLTIGQGKKKKRQTFRTWLEVHPSCQFQVRHIPLTGKTKNLERFDKCWTK